MYRYLHLFTFLFHLIGISFTVSAFANPAQRQIQVVDALTTTPLKGVSIQYISSCDTVITTSDTKGYFSLPLSSGTLYAQCAGYLPYSLVLDESTTAIIKLNKAPEILQEIVVTGTGTEHYLKDSPVQTEVISGEALREFSGRDIEEILGSISASISFGRSDMGSNLKINGLNNNYILILVDGKRLHGDVGGQVDLNRININQIQRIEVVKGASSALYGSDAIGGVINFITKKHNNKLGFSNDSRIGYYGDFNQANSFEWSNTKWNSTTAINYKRTDGWQNTSHEWYRQRLYENSTTKTVNASHSYLVEQTIHFTPNSLWKWKGGTSLSKRWVERPTGVPQWRLYNFHYRNQSYFLQANYKPHEKIAISWESSFDRNDYFYDYTQRDYTNFFDPDGNRIIYYPNERILQTSQRRAYSSIKAIYTPSLTHTLNSGIELIFDKLVSPYRLINNHAHAYSLSAYLQDEWNITPAWNITSGVRIGKHREFGYTIVPKLSILYKLPNINLRANYANGFKAPTIKEMYYHYHASIMSKFKAYYGNTNLKPQLSHYLAASVEVYTSRVKVDITAYHNRIKDMIALQPTSTSVEDKLLLIEETMRYENLAKAFSNGIDLNIEYKPYTNLKISASYSYLNAKAQQTEDPLAPNYLKYTPINSTAHHYATGRVFWKPFYTPFFKDLSCIISGKYQSKKYYLNDGDAKPFQTWRISLSYPIKKKKNVSIDFRTGVDNILNRVDRTPFGRNRASTTPGRTLFASISIKIKSNN